MYNNKEVTSDLNVSKVDIEKQDTQKTGLLTIKKSQMRSYARFASLELTDLQDDWSQQPNVKTAARNAKRGSICIHEAIENVRIQ